MVIPRARLPDIFGRMAHVMAQERLLQDRIKAGLTQLDAVAALLASDRVRYVSD